MRSLLGLVVPGARTQVILQSESSECGLACIAMIASHHGQKLGIRELRQRFPLSLKGANLHRLISIASQLNFLCRPLRLELDELGELQTPCILHWNMNHFVVLESVNSKSATILDPAIGRRRVSLDSVSENFTGVALELSQTADFKTKVESPSVSIRELTGPITGLWRSMGMILSLSLALQFFVILAPFLMQWVVDQVLVSADKDLLVVLALGFGIALLLQVSISLLRGWCVVFLSTQLGLQWMGNVFSHLLKLPMEFFEKRHLGDITSRMNSVLTIQRTMTTSFIEALIDGLMATVTLGMMLLYSWKISLITIAAVILYFLLRTLAFGYVREGTEQQLVASANQQSHLLESMRGIQSIKVSGREDSRRTTYFNLMNFTVNSEIRLAKLGLGFNGASQLIFGIERITVIFLGAILAMQSVFSVGMLIAYLAYKELFAGRVSSLIDKWIEFRMLRLHGERLADITLTKPENHGAIYVDKMAGIKNPDSFRKSAMLEASGLSFRYAEGEEWILQDCEFAINEGESVVIVGPSGCGKTTLVKLLLGLLNPSCGTISICGQDISRIGHNNYRTMVGAVMQDDQLFAGNIAENIAFGDDIFDIEDIEEAARLAAVHDEIAAMPMGYYSLIGDMGTTLSGGQKQRVILARALYRKPRILFLDEATSHLDVENEKSVNEAVSQLNMTRVIIAHRPETIASADRKLILNKGRVIREDMASDAIPMSISA